MGKSVMPASGSKSAVVLVTRSENVSLSSSVRSPQTVTGTCSAISPGEKKTLPVACTKSTPEVQPVPPTGPSVSGPLGRVREGALGKLGKARVGGRVVYSTPSNVLAGAERRRVKR